MNGIGRRFLHEVDDPTEEAKRPRGVRLRRRAGTLGRWCCVAERAGIVVGSVGEGIALRAGRGPWKALRWIVRFSRDGCDKLSCGISIGLRIATHVGVGVHALLVALHRVR